MAKIPRVYQRIFGSTAGATEIGKFGSLAAGTPEYATTIAEAMELSNWLDGWYEAVVANQNPAKQDENAIPFVLSTQIAYILQAGIPEWDTTTVYYIGSIVNSSGNIYVSLTDANTGNAVTDTTNWAPYKKVPDVQKFTAAGGGTYTTPANAKYIRVRMVGGGGGGGPSGSTAGTAASIGGDTTFKVTAGPTLLVAGGGAAGAANQTNPNAGGSASLGTGPVGLAIVGQQGQAGMNVAGSVNLFPVGGQGGSTPFGGGGGGAGGGAPTAGGTAAANSGGGGGGASGPNAVSPSYSGGGGGAGGYVEAVITSPAATYAYVVGSNGSKGTAGASGADGGDGAVGIIIVEAFF